MTVLDPQFDVKLDSLDIAVFRTEVPIEGSEAVRDGFGFIYTGKKYVLKGVSEAVRSLNE